MDTINKAIDAYNEKKGLYGRKKMTQIDLAKGIAKLNNQFPNQVINYQNLICRLANKKINKIPIDLIKPMCFILETDANFLFNI